MLRMLVVPTLAVLLCCTFAFAGGGGDHLLRMIPVEKNVTERPVISWDSPVIEADYDRYWVELVGWDVNGRVVPESNRDCKFIILKPVPGFHPMQKRSHGQPAMRFTSEVNEARFDLWLVSTDRHHWRLPALIRFNTLKRWPAGPFRPFSELAPMPPTVASINHYGLFRPFPRR